MFSYIFTVLLINISPGPAMLYVIDIAKKNGVKKGIFAVLGVELGVFIYLLITSLGLSYILIKYDGIFTFIQLLGAIYLIYLAYISLPRENNNYDNEKKVLGTQKKSGYIQIFVKGFFLNATNPKIIFFFFSIIPQFIDNNVSQYTIFIYGLIFNLGGMIVNFFAAVIYKQITNVLRWKFINYMIPLVFFIIGINVIIENIYK